MHLPNLTQEEIGHLNRLIKENESIINNLLIEKAPSPDGFTSEFYQTFNENIIHILYNFLESKSKRNNSYEAKIDLIQKKKKTLQENYRSLSLMNCNNSQQNINKSNITVYQKNYTA